MRPQAWSTWPAATPSAPFDDNRFDGVGVIRTKRTGGELTARQIRDLMRAYLSGEFAEEQMSALLMAIFWRGMTAAETAEWTGAMIASGSRADLSGLGRPSVDKHSTGGVGDKLSLIIVPLVAVFGAAVPQMSGRGLGHTGGTLDKLESIPAGTPTWIPPHCSGCWTRSAASSRPRATKWHPPTIGCTHCATSRPPSTRSR
jgi:hypothetical protein